CSPPTVTGRRSGYDCRVGGSPLNSLKPFRHRARAPVQACAGASLIVAKKPGLARENRPGLSRHARLMAAASEVTPARVATSAADADSTRDRIACSWNMLPQK